MTEAEKVVLLKLVGLIEAVNSNAVDAATAESGDEKLGVAARAEQQIDLYRNLEKEIGSL